MRTLSAFGVKLAHRDSHDRGCPHSQARPGSAPIRTTEAAGSRLRHLQPRSGESASACVRRCFTFACLEHEVASGLARSGQRADQELARDKRRSDSNRASRYASRRLPPGCAPRCSASSCSFSIASRTRSRVVVADVLFLVDDARHGHRRNAGGPRDVLRSSPYPDCVGWTCSSSPFCCRSRCATTRIATAGAPLMVALSISDASLGRER